jgi:DNA-binding GntR family transcriptional regulator
MARSALSSRKQRSAPPIIPLRDASEPRKGRLHQFALSMLREMIQSGEIPPGERLMEKPMSERLGMSRTPVREAFRTLAVEGLVTLLPNQGVVVAELDKEKSGDVCLLLGALESFAARQACQRITVRQLEELRTLQDRLERYYEASDRPRYTETNRAIHRLMVEASRNPSLISVWSMIIPRAERARSLKNLDRMRWASSIDSHRKIFAALMARDGDLLSSLMQTHFAHVVIDSMEDPSAFPRPASDAGEFLVPRARRTWADKA